MQAQETNKTDFTKNNYYEPTQSMREFMMELAEDSGCDPDVVNKNLVEYLYINYATYYARFETVYTVKFAAQTKQVNGSFKTDTVGGKVSVASVTDVDGVAASSKATANSGYKFLGWYDKDGNQLSANATYYTKTTSATNKVTYYARFEIVYNPTAEKTN